jgi:hypothetical protein
MHVWMQKMSGDCACGCTTTTAAAVAAAATAAAATALQRSRARTDLRQQALHTLKQYLKAPAGQYTLSWMLTSS